MNSKLLNENKNSVMHAYRECVRYLRTPVIEEIFSRTRIWNFHRQQFKKIIFYTCFDNICKKVFYKMYFLKISAGVQIIKIVACGGPAYNTYKSISVVTKNFRS